MVHKEGKTIPTTATTAQKDEEFEKNTAQRISSLISSVLLLYVRKCEAQFFFPLHTSCEQEMRWDEMRLRDNMKRWKKKRKYVCRGNKKRVYIIGLTFRMKFFFCCCFHLWCEVRVEHCKKGRRGEGRVNGINTWSLPPHPMCTYIFIQTYINVSPIGNIQWYENGKIILVSHLASICLWVSIIVMGHIKYCRISFQLFPPSHFFFFFFAVQFLWTKCWFWTLFCLTAWKDLFFVEFWEFIQE